MGEASRTDDAVEVETCRCGWPLPLSVFAHSNTADPSGKLRDSARIPNTHVQLCCPRCRAGHAFFGAEDMAKGIV